jgi:uncharacterized coiled-coil protein SlyX
VTDLTTTSLETVLGVYSDRMRRLDSDLEHLERQVDSLHRAIADRQQHTDRELAEVRARIERLERGQT